MAKIYLNIDILKKSTKKVEFLECFSFAMMIKITFTSSLVKNATIRNLKSIFGIGTTKMTRILKNSLKYGFVQYDEYNNLLALPLSVKEKGQYHYCFKFKRCKDRKNNPKCQYKISTIMSELRSIVLLNNIKTKDALLDQLNRVGDANKIEAKSVKEKAKKSILRQMSEMKHIGLSVDRMTRVLNCSTYQARKAISILMAKRQVRKRINRFIIQNEMCEPVVKSKRQFSIIKNQFINEYLEVVIRNSSSVFTVMSNEYFYNSDRIVIFKKTINSYTDWKTQKEIRKILKGKKEEAEKFNEEFMSEIGKDKMNRKEVKYDFDLNF